MSATPIDPMSKRQQIIALAKEQCDVSYVFDRLGGQVPKSQIRAVLSDATQIGEISGEWRVRSVRRRPIKIKTDRFSFEIPATVRDAIDLAADDRAIPPADLMAKILTTVFTEGLVDAVLDDGAAA